MYKKMEEDRVGPKFTCLHCGYSWVSTRRHPKRCPYCKTYWWFKPRIRNISRPIIYSDPYKDDVQQKDLSSPEQVRPIIKEKVKFE